MIAGAISRHRAYVNLSVRSPSGQQAEVEFVLDTGFNGVITLPRAACVALGLPYVRPQPAGVAGGNRIMLEVYECYLLWDGAERDVELLAMDGPPLIGMTLLDGSDVHLQVTEGGLVTIESL